jgi:hypothetical protein
MDAVGADHEVERVAVDLADVDPEPARHVAGGIDQDLVQPRARDAEREPGGMPHRVELGLEQHTPAGVSERPPPQQSPIALDGLANAEPMQSPHRVCVHHDAGSRGGPPRQALDQLRSEARPGAGAIEADSPAMPPPTIRMRMPLSMRLRPAPG